MSERPPKRKQFTQDFTCLQDQMELMEITEKLIERNKELEQDRKNLINAIKQEVQISGHIVFEKFNSF